jgi:hypothetical protein
MHRTTIGQRALDCSFECLHEEVAPVHTGKASGDPTSSSDGLDSVDLQLRFICTTFSRALPDYLTSQHAIVYILVPIVQQPHASMFCASDCVTTC